jgi:hypothetical protein
MYVSTLVFAFFSLPFDLFYLKKAKKLEYDSFFAILERTDYGNREG